MYKLMNWITLYLSNQSQIVKLSLSLHTQSNLSIVRCTSRISLGPLQFLILINDLSQMFYNNVKVLLFAD